jgi:RHS repeat-associated protein
VNTEGYRFGFNGQEKSPEIAEGHTTAEFWEYDSRIGRRWNLDPMPQINISDYATFRNNPIYLIDPNGRSPLDHFFDLNGSYLGSTKEGNNIRVVNKDNTFEQAAIKPLENSKLITDFDYSEDNTSSIKMLSNVSTYYASKVGLNQKIGVSRVDKAGGFAYTDIKTDKVFMAEYNGKINPNAFDANNVMNSFFHERDHVEDHTTSQPLKHAEVVINQMGHSTFAGTTQNFKSVAVGYIETLLNEALENRTTKLSEVQAVIDKANKFSSQTLFELFINESTNKVEQTGVLPEFIITDKKN